MRTKLDVNRTSLSEENKNDIKTIPKLGYLHVFRLSSEGTEASLTSFLKQSAPEIHFRCEKLKRKDDMPASFKVAFPLSKVNEVYNPDIWPRKCTVQRFTFLKKFPKPASPDQATTMSGLVMVKCPVS
ncbi:hypothetical protein JTB14_006419 [Gonioctena quinquepunctata]|nr:hypothetical protein JTB14_006419 [Gonioctena quinquepunctata]